MSLCHVHNSKGLHWLITKVLGVVNLIHNKRLPWFVIILLITTAIIDVFTTFTTFKFKIFDMFTRSFSYKMHIHVLAKYVFHYFYLSNINLWLNEISRNSFSRIVKDYTACTCVYFCSFVRWFKSNYCNLPSLAWFFCFQKKTGKISRRCQSMAPFRKTSEKQSMNCLIGQFK